MAYSDYGGHVERSGIRVRERSDAAPTPDGLVSTPGSYPGWSFPVVVRTPSYHALLGDGPVFVGLLKQTTFVVMRGPEEIDPNTILTGREDLPEGVLHDDGWIDSDPLLEKGRPLRMEVDGHRIEIFWTREDNFYVYARLTQPDGTVWTGWSGYGVGAGHEDVDHHDVARRRDAKLWELTSDADREIEED